LWEVFSQNISESGQANLAEATALQQHINNLQRNLMSLLDTFVAQSILSKDSAIQSTTEQFVYWQIPNPMMAKSGVIDILIRKDRDRKKKNLDPNKAKIILKVETPELGEVGIVVDVLENRIWYLFHTDNEYTKEFITKMTEDLKQRMAALNYDLVGFQAIKKRLDVKKVLLPTFNLDHLSRIRTEV